mgnify:CR=1 FL=1
MSVPDRARVKENILAWFDENGQRFKDLSKQIWDLAELQFQEFQSSALLMDILREAGFTVTAGAAGMPTAFVAEYRSGDGPVVAVMGEYDALKGLGCEIAGTCRPTGGSGHGCGHNLLGTGAAAAAIAARYAMEANGIHGTVKYFGCPAEEGGGAKVFMVREHVFDGVDAVFGWHPANANIVSEAAAMAIMSVRYRFHGRAAHAGVCPHLGRSALDAAILMDVGVNYLREHVQPDVRIQSVITNGGKVPNVVPDEAEIWYYIRAPRRQDLDAVYHRVNLIAEGMAHATETTVERLVGAGASSNGLPNSVISALVRSNLAELGGPVFDAADRAFAAELNREVSLQEKAQSMAQMYQIYDEKIYSQDLCEYVQTATQAGVTAPYSGDGSDVAWTAPTAQLNTCCQPVGTGNHSWQQVVASGSAIGQKGMIAAAKVIAMSLCDALCRPDLLAEARKELDAHLTACAYHCPIPPEVQPGTMD